MAVLRSSDKDRRSITSELCVSSIQLILGQDSEADMQGSGSSRSKLNICVDQAVVHKDLDVQRKRSLFHVLLCRSCPGNWFLASWSSSY